MVVTMQHSFAHVLHQHSPLAQDGRTALMSVLKREMAEDDKLEMVKLLLKNNANIFTQDNVSAGGIHICMFLFSGLRRDVLSMHFICGSWACASPEAR